MVTKNQSLPTRPCLIHYHIYKNAGTSVDSLLQKSFGPRWSVFEGGSATDIISSERLAEFLAARPDLLAISSHLARPPLPCESAYPIVFLRHPIERARSVYAFAAADPHQPDHEIAKARGFRGYVEWALRSKDGGIVIRNYQVVHLSEASFRAPHIYLTEATASDLATARDLIRSWKLCGIVDRFTDSCHLRLRRGPRYVRQDIQVTLAPSVSRRVIPFAATVLRSGTTRRYRSRVPSLNDSTPSI